MSKVEVILLKDLKGSGKKGDIISVAEGYARNCLLPMGTAKIADDFSIKELEMQKEAELKRHEKEFDRAKEVKSMIDNQSVDVYVLGGENGKLFGSVTSQDVSDALDRKFGIKIDKRKIKSTVEGLKIIDTFGTYPYEVKVYTGVSASIRVNVKDKSE